MQYFLKIINAILLLIALVTSANSHAQTLVQVCNESLDPSVCVVNPVSPNYKDSLYQYLIYRDIFAKDVIKIGKNVNNNSPNARVNLELDIYLPCNNEVDRPLVLVPRAVSYTSQNGKSSLEIEADYRYLLQELAVKGFVVVAYEYRTYTKIFNPGFYFDITPNANNGNALDSCAVMAFVNGAATVSNHYYRCHSCLMNAGKENEAEAFKKLIMYNLKQDALAAVGYAVTDPNGLGINVDPEKVFIGGISNGAQVALSSAYIDSDDYSSGFFENTITNLYGEFNSIQYAVNLDSDFEFKGVFGLWGSIHDLDWIDSNDPPALMIHGAWDQVIPYQSNYAGFGAYGDSSKFWTHGSEDIACKFITEGVDFGLVTVNKGVHGFFKQNSPCEPDTVCGMVISDEVIDQVAATLKRLTLYNGGNSFAKGFNPLGIPCNNFVQLDVPIDYLIGVNSEGECISDNDHIPYSLSKLIDYCNCGSQQSALQSNGHLKSTDTKEKEILVYPNPSSENVTIESQREITNLSLYTLSGNRLNMTISERRKNKITLDLSSLSPGIYFLRIDANLEKLVVSR